MVRTKEAARKQMHDWRRKNPLQYLLTKAKSRAKEVGLEFNLELSDIEVPEFCPILGIPISQFNGRFAPNTLSLDRIDNTKGYVKGNVAVISLKANKYKSDMTLENVRALLHYMELKSVW